MRKRGVLHQILLRFHPVTINPGEAVTIYDRFGSRGVGANEVALEVVVSVREFATAGEHPEG